MIKMDCLSRLTVSKIIRVTTVIYDYTIHREIIYTQNGKQFVSDPNHLFFCQCTAHILLNVQNRQLCLDKPGYDLAKEI